MYGAVPPPPARTRAAGAGVVLVRVLLTAGPILTIGLLAFAPLLRIAALRRRWWEWTLAAASFVVAIVLFAVVGTLPEDALGTNLSMSGLLLLAVASAVWFLVFDIRRHTRLRAGLPPAYAPAGYGPAAALPGAAPAPGYGYPPYASAPTVPMAPPPGVVPYVPPQPSPWAVPAAPPAPAPPAPGQSARGFGPAVPATPPPAGPRQAPAAPRTPRIDQVRAELDELSDLLRGGPAAPDGSARRGDARDEDADAR
ncbi:hypothetical protein [Streptomyces fuscigenes]|uniref:hypothetical protein n=1 Tax=Streptomyces fuscigenes TaxID=1528880 RepID=UPI001F188B09|nr:hypothetical protein [Streptomyces fuscigenes]MCF3965228.1 hypothetical protein [Streptomyces fuscigenes]